MAKSRDPKKWADRAKMRADEVARQRDNALLRKEQFKARSIPGVDPYTGHTNLSAMYDNDGNPIHAEPKGYKKFSGH